MIRIRVSAASLLLPLFILGCGSGPADPDLPDLSMMVSENVVLETTGSTCIAVPLDAGMDEVTGAEWIDSWTSDGSGWVWYTPEQYSFEIGDQVSCNVFFALETEDPWRFIRTDVFYECGQTDWRRWIYMHTEDFGTLPPLPPDYGYISGITYKIPANVPASVDWASRLRLDDYILDTGTPLSGRPGCFRID
jgi:hypothetical protein